MLSKIIAVLILSCCSLSLSAQSLYILRHFEKQADSPNPALTETGSARAEMLAAMLQREPITHIFTSDYRRTRASVAPLARALGISVSIYDPRDLPALASQLSGLAQAVVVGHSNTTPQLVRLLGGTAEDMDESRYGDLFVISQSQGVVTTTRLSVPVGYAPAVRP
ncbi:SixA phosphatase family protein [Simiduia aestuariiviva]|uniref:Phosphohistidine phosphatase SixA n=1 Tax=Simiduia aestuariiviva TaxID=1510459 RepID=A0A839UVJ7_9GAMM|nr:histidine phosphatase family protein [Simiduia aestuariiviva]MBB3169387.1 phosphohistidine phosphatase SixA [Simiduia aestuariiviva]